MRLRSQPLLAALVAGTALALGGCGGGGGSDDPASIAPASAPIYIQATLQPSGQLKTNTNDALSTITGSSDPGKLIVDQIDKGFQSSGGKLTYAADVKPWLGDQVGTFVDRLGPDVASAGVVQTTDSGAAQDFIDKASATGSQTAKDSSYKGVDYKISENGTAVGIVDNFLVLGNVAGFKEAVDTSKGGDALTGNGDFSKTIGGAPSGSIADVYLSLDPIVKAIEATSTSGGGQVLQTALGQTKGKTALASLIPSGDRIEADLSTNYTGTGSGGSGDASALIGGFPAASFAAVGGADLGASLDRGLTQLEQAGIPGLSAATLQQRLGQLGLSLNELTSLKGFGLFVEGTSPQKLGAALVLTASDPKAASDISKAVTTVVKGSSSASVKPIPGGFSLKSPGAPQPFLLQAKGSRIAFGYGSKATSEALSGSTGTLADTQLYKQAAGALGDLHLSGYFDLPAIFRLAEAAGASSDPGYLAAKRYLAHLSYATFGSGVSGGNATSKIILGLQK